MSGLPRRLALASTTLLLALGAVELGVRTLAPQPDGAPLGLLRGPFTTPGDHPVRTEEYAVTVHVNRHGFVDREWADSKRGPRVVVVGDSFVQAAQVPLEAGYGRRLEAELGGLAEVESVGVPGAGQATELDLLAAVILPRDPDVVVLGFLVANDVLNNHPLLEQKDDKPFYRLRGGVLERVDAVGWDPPGGPLWRASATWRLVARAAAERRVATQKLEAGRGVPLDLRVYDPTADPTWEEAWAVTDALLAEMARRCTAAGARLVVVLFPDAVSAGGAGREAAVTRWPALGGWDLEAPTRRAAALAARHATVVDLAPGFAAHAGPAGVDAPPPSALHLPRDGHWTAEGHALAARLSAPAVREALSGSGARPPPP